TSAKIQDFPELRSRTIVLLCAPSQRRQVRRPRRRSCNELQNSGASEWRKYSRCRSPRQMRMEQPMAEPSLTLREWCDLRKISKTGFYELKRQGRAPQTHTVSIKPHGGAKLLISPEAACVVARAPSRGRDPQAEQHHLKRNAAPRGGGSQFRWAANQ